MDNLETVAACGVDMIVTGSAVFGTDDPEATTRTMVRKLAAMVEDGTRC